MQKPKQVVVVGAGVIGVSIAERLQYEGKQVVLIDRLQPGEGCSKGNAGHFASDIVLPLANWRSLVNVPRWLLNSQSPLTIRWPYFFKLLPWLWRFAWEAMPHKSAKTIAALKCLNRPAIQHYSRLLQRTSLQHLMTQNGALTLYQTTKSEKAVQEHLVSVRSHGVNVETLSGGEIRELEPEISDSVLGGLYYQDTAHSVDPHQLVKSLAEHFCRQGGELIRQNVLAIEPDSSGFAKVKMGSNSIHAEQVVIACGAWSNELVNQLGHSVPLETERGYHLMLSPTNCLIARPVTSFEQSFVMTPMTEGLRLAGTVELAGLTAEPDFRRADQLLDHAIKVLPALNSHQGSKTKWMGHRPSTPDSLPVIGRSPYHSNILFAFGHQHLGLTQAAVTAEWLSRLILEQPIESNLDPFKIDRF